MGTRQKRGGFFFLFLLPARANTAAAVKHCGGGELSRRLSLYLCLPQLRESLLISGSCVPSFPLFSFLPHFPLSCSHSCCPRGSMLLSDHPGGCSEAQRPRGQQEHTLASFFFLNGTHSIHHISQIFVFHCILMCGVICYSVCIAVLSGYHPPLLCF